MEYFWTSNCLRVKLQGDPNKEACVVLKIVIQAFTLNDIISLNEYCYLNKFLLEKHFKKFKTVSTRSYFILKLNYIIEFESD